MKIVLRCQDYDRNREPNVILISFSQRFNGCTWNDWGHGRLGREAVAWKRKVLLSCTW